MGWSKRKWEEVGEYFENWKLAENWTFLNSVLWTIWWLLYFDLPWLESFWLFWTQKQTVLTDRNVYVLAASWEQNLRLFHFDTEKQSTARTLESQQIEQLFRNFSLKFRIPNYHNQHSDHFQLFFSIFQISRNHYDSLTVHSHFSCFSSLKIDNKIVKSLACFDVILIGGEACGRREKGNMRQSRSTQNCHFCCYFWEEMVMMIRKNEKRV